MSGADELTSTAFSAVQSLTRVQKAKFLLNTALSLIEDGRYGQEVENFLDIYLKIPNLPKSDVVKALLARGSARKESAERLLRKAQQDFQAVRILEPSNWEVQQHLRNELLIRFFTERASERVPLEIWDRIAACIPRYYLRSWLFLSRRHRDIALRHIFRTIDIYFGDDQENLNRGLDILERVKADSIFANRVKCLRLHWSSEDGEMLDLLLRIFRTALPEFKALEEFEWIGYPELRAEMVRVLLANHAHVRSLGLIGWHFDAVGVSAFENLRKFTLRAEDDDGFADMGEVRTVLDRNEDTLRHLILGADLERNHSWDLIFRSVTIKNLTHLDLVDTRISHLVLTRIAHAHNLQSLTLHGTLEDPDSAAIVFGSDHIIDDKHTFLPHLEAFRFLLVGQEGVRDNLKEESLYRSVAQFLRQRSRLRNLDLGSCPFDLGLAILPDLTSLRVLGIRIPNVTQASVKQLVNFLPKEMTAIRLSAAESEKSMHVYASLFTPFNNLSFLHFQCVSKRRPNPNTKDQTELWSSGARAIATCVPSIDFMGWHGEHYVVVRSSDGQNTKPTVDLKELPVRRRRDCAKGVDLGSDDAMWLERKDIPMEFDMPGLQ